MHFSGINIKNTLIFDEWMNSLNDSLNMISSIPNYQIQQSLKEVSLLATVYLGASKYISKSICQIL